MNWEEIQGVVAELLEAFYEKTRDREMFLFGVLSDDCRERDDDYWADFFRTRAETHFRSLDSEPVKYGESRRVRVSWDDGGCLQVTVVQGFIVDLKWTGARRAATLILEKS